MRAESGVRTPNRKTHTVARFRAPTKKPCHLESAHTPRDVIPNRAESPVRNLLLGCARSPAAASRITPGCGKHLEILWDAAIDGIHPALYGYKVSRTVGFALTSRFAWTEFAPLRRT